MVQAEPNTNDGFSSITYIAGISVQQPFARVAGVGSLWEHTQTRYNGAFSNTVLSAHVEYLKTKRMIELRHVSGEVEDIEEWTPRPYDDNARSASLTRSHCMTDALNYSSTNLAIR
jgi:hypothetical protein